MGSGLALGGALLLGPGLAMGLSLVAGLGLGTALVPGLPETGDPGLAVMAGLVPGPGSCELNRQALYSNMSYGVPQYSA